MQPKTETAGAPREGNRPQISALGQAQSNCNPVDLILSRLEGTKRYGDGYTAKCPAHQDRHASLSVCEGDDGRALVHCFAGCTTADVVASVGLNLADLFIQRPNVISASELRNRRAYSQMATWRAALEVIATEACVVHIAGEEVLEGQKLSPEDSGRLKLAVDRLFNARHLLGLPVWTKPREVAA